MKSKIVSRTLGLLSTRIRALSPVVMWVYVRHWIYFRALCFQDYYLDRPHFLWLDNMLRNWMWLSGKWFVEELSGRANRMRYGKRRCDVWKINMSKWCRYILFLNVRFCCRNNVSMYGDIFLHLSSLSWVTLILELGSQEFWIRVLHEHWSKMWQT